MFANLTGYKVGPIYRLRHGLTNAAKRSRAADVLALGGIAATTLIAAWLLLYDGTLIGQDSATQFYPWYDYLGERLRSGEIPAWNPHQFGGAPFAANPQSGWTYLPAMVLFTVLPLSLAVPAFLVVHLALVGVATYALARILGLGAFGSLVAAVGYQLSGPVLGRSVCCPASFEVFVWTPVALLGAEMAIRGRDNLGRLFGWIVAGFALSQVFAAWLGQGAYYLLIALGSYVFYRTVLVPVVRRQRAFERLRNLALHGGAIIVIGFGLAAAGVLPRLDYVSRSNLAGGEYSGQNAWAAQIGGATPDMVFERFLNPDFTSYPGAIIVCLALIAPCVARRWYALPFLAGFGIVALVLATPWDTPLHLAMYAALPRFEVLHQHWPERISMVALLVLPLLAGATVDRISRGRLEHRRSRVMLTIGVVAALLLLSWQADSRLEAAGWIAAAAGLTGVLMLLSGHAIRVAVPALLLLLVMSDLVLGFQGLSSTAPYGGFHRVDLDSHYAPDGAAAFLDERADDGLGRYFGFDPSLWAISQGQRVLYRYDFAEHEANELLVNNLATLHGLDDIQGYDPVQPSRFTKYLIALNGHVQEYHDANVHGGGLSSPLLDMLNVRYIVIPATPSPERPVLYALEDRLPTVYRDEQVQVLANPEAFPRSWIVHNARQVQTGEALPLLVNGEVDPRRTVLIEGPLPPLSAPLDPAAEHVYLTQVEPEYLRMETSSTAPGLLVLSEPYDPDWRAYIDGEQVPLYAANHLLRAVPLPVGEHVVEMRYEPQPMRIGAAISFVTIFGIAILAAVFARQRTRSSQARTMVERSF